MPKYVCFVRSLAYCMIPCYFFNHWPGGGVFFTWLLPQAGLILKYMYFDAVIKEHHFSNVYFLLMNTQNVSKEVFFSTIGPRV